MILIKIINDYYIIFLSFFYFRMINKGDDLIPDNTVSPVKSN